MSVGTKLAIAGAVVASVTAFVAYLGATSSWQYYLTVDECVAKPQVFAGHRVRVAGRVAPGTLVIEEDRLTATFELAGNAGRLRTACPGPLPDNLAEDMEVVVEGNLDDSGHLNGEKVLTRCASKYESQ